MRISAARRAALDFLHKDRYLRERDWDIFLDATLSAPDLADPRDRRLVSHLVSGCVRLRGRLDSRLRRLTGRTRLDAVVQTAMRLALYQLEEMDRLPPHAVVGEAVEWVKEQRGPRLAGWVNANLRRFLREGLPGDDPDPVREPLKYATAHLSYPDWLARRWIGELGKARALSLMESMNGRRGICFRLNSLKTSASRVIESAAGEGAEIELISDLPVAFRVLGAVPQLVWEALEEGLISVQDEAAQRVAHLMAAVAPAPWVDLCAAPGGKSTHLAELSGNQETVLALDRSPQRLEKVIANARRLGLDRIRAEVADVLVAPALPMGGVLLDAPCSALGVLAENPDARWRRSEEDITVLAARQSELLDAAAAWVRPGGVLVYSVCTLTPEETEGQAGSFLERHKDFRLEETASPLFIWPDDGGGSGTYAACFRRKD